MSLSFALHFVLNISGLVLDSLTWAVTSLEVQVGSEFRAQLLKHRLLQVVIQCISSLYCLAGKDYGNEAE